METGQPPGIPSRHAVSGLSDGFRASDSLMTAKLRAYSPRDRVRCLRIFDSNRPRSFADAERAQFESYLERHGDAYYVVERLGSIVGCGGYALDAAGKSADLCWGMIDEGLHRKGLGEYLLLGRLRAIAVRDRITRVRLATSQHAEGFYARYGFKVASRTANGFGPGLDNIEMRLNLTGKARARILASWSQLGQNAGMIASRPHANRGDKTVAGREEWIECRTPKPGSRGTRIPKWKYDAVRTAIRAVVPRDKDGIEFRALSALVAKTLPAATRGKLGSVRWHTVTVKLHMEVTGELARIAGSKPQRIRRVR